MANPTQDMLGATQGAGQFHLPAGAGFGFPIGGGKKLVCDLKVVDDDGGWVSCTTSTANTRGSRDNVCSSPVRGVEDVPGNEVDDGCPCSDSSVDADYIDDVEYFCGRFGWQKDEVDDLLGTINELQLYPNDVFELLSQIDQLRGALKSRYNRRVVELLEESKQDAEDDDWLDAVMELVSNARDAKRDIDRASVLEIIVLANKELVS